MKMVLNSKLPELLYIPHNNGGPVVQYWVSVLLAVYGAALVAASRMFLRGIDPTLSLLADRVGNEKQSAAGLPTIPIRAVCPFS